MLAVNDRMDLLAEQFMLAPPKRSLRSGIHKRESPVRIEGIDPFAQVRGDGFREIQLVAELRLCPPAFRHIPYLF